MNFHIADAAFFGGGSVSRHYRVLAGTERALAVHELDAVRRPVFLPLVAAGAELATLGIADRGPWRVPKFSRTWNTHDSQPMSLGAER
jgi:hypothetical protein